MAGSGTSVGTVIRWDDEQCAGIIESPELPADCWVDADAVHSRTGRGLRAGQVVEVDWVDSGSGEHPVRAIRVTPRDDLQATPGG